MFIHFPQQTVSLPSGDLQLSPELAHLPPGLDFQQGQDLLPTSRGGASTQGLEVSGEICRKPWVLPSNRGLCTSQSVEVLNF